MATGQTEMRYGFNSSMSNAGGMRMTPGYLTVSQVSERLQVSRQTVLREIKAGRLDAMIISGRGDYRISEDALALWVSNRNPAA